MRGLVIKLLAVVVAVVAVVAVLSVVQISHAGDHSPQELQTSVKPARQRVIPEGYYPVTRVRLPERAPERMKRAENEPEPTAWFHNFAAGTNDVFAARAPEPSFVRDAWYANFAAGENDIFAQPVETAKPARAWYENFAAGANDIFGPGEFGLGDVGSGDADAPEERRVEREASVDRDGYLIFGQAVASATGYASMPPPDVDDRETSENDRPRIPKPFTFRSDDSPVILADITSPGPDNGAVASRRVGNRAFGGRRPAEIIEREPYVPPRPRHGDAPVGDTPAMAPPHGGQMPRTEVRLKLPTSSSGLGMASGFFPGR